MLQIGPEEERRIILMLKMVLMNTYTYCKLNRRHYLHSFITVVLAGTTKPKTKSRADTKKTKQTNLFRLHAMNLL